MAIPIPTFGEVLGLLQAVIGAVLTLLLFSLRHAFRGGREVQQFVSRLEKAEESATEASAGTERLSAEVRRLSTDVQAVPERLRHEFLPRETADLQFKQGNEDRVRLDAEVRRLWMAVRTRPGRT